MPLYKVKNKHIQAMREAYRADLMEEQSYSAPMNQSDPMKARLPFLSKLFLYSGIQKSIMSSPLFNATFHQQGDIIDFLTCDPSSWPMCLLDFSF